MKATSKIQGISSNTMLKLGAVGALAAAAALSATPARADDFKLPPISIGAGVRSSFAHIDNESPNKDGNDFTLNSARIYLGGSVTKEIKLTFNTEYVGANASPGDGSVQVIDAIARFEFAPEFNIWAGRFLPPSDRSNLYGPYYANNSQVYTDGIQDGFPAYAAGRANGVAYWGDFDKLAVSAGVFDVPSTVGGPNSDNVVLAGRVQYDFWDKEGGYYLNGTYYGAKDLLAVGVAAQTTDGNTAVTGDFLLEKKLGNAGVATVEAEYASYDGFGGYNAAGAAFTKSDGYYVLGSYLFPQVVGIGKIQVLGKYGQADYTALNDFNQKTTEVDLNYIIKDFNARVGLFYLDTSLSNGLPDTSQFGVQVQLQI